MLHQVIGKARELTSLATDSRQRDFHRQRRMTSVAEREELADIVAETLPSHPVDARLGGLLRRDGLATLPNLLEPSQIAEIRAYLADKLVRDPYHGLPPFRAAGAFPAETRVAYHDTADVLECPHLLAVANHPAVLAAATGYLGAKPTLSALRVWWSAPANGEAERMQLFHRDVDDLRFLKLFVYLTDVDEQSGPHVFIKGSHRDDRLTEIRRYSDEEITSVFGTTRETTLTGVAGTSFLEATYGMHRGLPPRDQPRLIFQPLYTLRPTIYAPRKPLRMVRDGERIDAYTSRLFVRHPSSALAK